MNIPQEFFLVDIPFFEQLLIVHNLGIYSHIILPYPHQ